MVSAAYEAPKDEHEPAGHISVYLFTNFTPNCPGVFLKPPTRRKYVHGRRTTEGALTFQMRAAPNHQGGALLNPS